MGTSGWNRSSKWVMGLRPRFEEVWDSFASPATIIGRGKLGRDMVEVVEVEVLRGKAGDAGVTRVGAKFQFSYPVNDGDDFDMVYYSIVGMLSRL